MVVSAQEGVSKSIFHLSFSIFHFPFEGETATSGPAGKEAGWPRAIIVRESSRDFVPLYSWPPWRLGGFFFAFNGNGK